MVFSCLIIYGRGACGDQRVRGDGVSGVWRGAWLNAHGAHGHANGGHGPCAHGGKLFHGLRFDGACALRGDDGQQLRGEGPRDDGDRVCSCSSPLNDGHLVLSIN